jgi:hypothetical protein
MKKVKHSKFKNTGILFELLVRQITLEVLNGDASRSEKRPSFLKVNASSSMIKLNRAKIEVRCRVKPCPRGFNHPCSFCWLGYDNCPAAVHPVTYVERYCTMCKSEGWFDPGEDSLACHRCRQNYMPIESDTETDADTNVVTGENNEH